MRNSFLGVDNNGFARSLHEPLLLSKKKCQLCQKQATCWLVRDLTHLRQKKLNKGVKNCCKISGKHKCSELIPVIIQYCLFHCGTFAIPFYELKRRHHRPKVPRRMQEMRLYREIALPQLRILCLGSAPKTPAPESENLQSQPTFLLQAPPIRVTSRPNSPAFSHGVCS